MRILFLTNKAPYPPKDGGSIASLGLIEAFANAGYRTGLLAMNTRKHHITPFDIPNEITSKIVTHLIEVPANITIYGAIKNLLFSKKPYNAERFINKNYRKKLALLLQAHHFDIVQLEGLYLCPYINTIRQNSKALIAYRSHNIEHEIWERSVKQARGFKKIYLKILTKRIKRFEQKAINSYDVLIPITQRDNKKLQQMGNTKPSLVIPAGFDTQKFGQNTKSESAKNDLFFIGALDWAPNQEALLWFFEKCWPGILKKAPQTTLTIAGRNAPNWFVNKINQKNVFYEGEVESAHQFMRNHGIMIAPLLSGSGMRVKIVEAMMLKKPIVTTPIGCEGIDACNNKEIIIANTANDFTNKTIDLISNSELRSILSENSFIFAHKHYSNNELVKKLSDFYKKFV